MDYQERFYAEVFFPYLIENDIKHILHLGDYYDNRKTINFKALVAGEFLFIKFFIAVLSKASGPKSPKC